MGTNPTRRTRTPQPSGAETSHRTIAELVSTLRKHTWSERRSPRAASISNATVPPGGDVG